MLVFFGFLTLVFFVASVSLFFDKNKSATGSFIFPFCFGVITYMLLPNAQQDAYDIAYKTCDAKWDANDTMRNTALLIVQIQFKKLDQLSLAPSDSFGAIRIICENEANKAKDAIRLSIEHQSPISASIPTQSRKSVPHSKSYFDDFFLKLFPNPND